MSAGGGGGITIGPNFSMGGRTRTDLTGLIVLGGGASTAGNYTSLKESNGTSGYTASGGILRLIGLRWRPITGGGAAYFTLGYGNTAVLNTGAPTTPIYIFDMDGSAAHLNPFGAPTITNSASEPDFFQMALDFEVPDTRIPFFRVGVGSVADQAVVVYAIQE